MEKVNVMFLSAASSRRHEAVGRKWEALILQSFSKGQVSQALSEISKRTNTHIPGKSAVWMDLFTTCLILEAQLK